ncbi:MAG TPA: hypothetical protein VJW73_18910, partial [Gemmatimonadaceae bacterium]|nr:hypothetical protein [Gemmatimonadaceae bacterium]
ALGRDLAMANRGDTAAQPQLKDVPANPTSTSNPTKTAPRTTQRPSNTTSRSTSNPSTRPNTPTTTASGNTVTHPSAGGSNSGGAVGTIAAGTTLSLTPTANVCTNTNKVGDKITMTTQNTVTGSNGATIPAGSTVTLTVTNLKRSENSNDQIIMEFAVNSVNVGGRSYPLDASIESAPITRVRNQPKSKDAQKVAIGAGIGAIAGQILGKNTKSTVIGGAVGAAAGAAAAAATANYEGCVNSTSTVTIKLNSATQVRA